MHILFLLIDGFVTNQNGVGQHPQTHEELIHRAILIPLVGTAVTGR